MGRHLTRTWFATLVCLILVGCGALGWLTDGDLSRWHASPMPEWEEAFQVADPCWRGADGAYSVPLSSSRTLWLFGDTWITKPEARGREGGRVIRNSLAIQEIGGNGPGGIEFFWKEGDEGPRAVFVPPAEPGWLWPLSGERVGEFLYLFLGEFIGNDSKLGFESSGCWLYRVANPDEPPGIWEIDRFRVPFFEHTPNGDVSFGAGCISHEGFLYVYGIREDWSRGVEGRSLLVARTPFEALEAADFAEWRFFSGEGWTKEVSQCAALFDGAATEMSVSHFPGRDAFLAVYTYCGLSAEILARRAPHPAGPWGKPMTLYQCPEVSRREDYFCYAGKAHPELAEGRNDLVVTYAANSWNMEDHRRDLRLYWPRFVRLVKE